MSIARLMQQAAAGVPTGGGGVWTDPDLANASYDSVSFSVAGEETNPRGMFFKLDGSKVYIVGSTGDDVNEYDLSTAWDISTASYVQNFSVSAQTTFPVGIFFKADGVKMYVAGGTGIHEYDLSSAWDVSTASYNQSFSTLSQGSPQSIFFRSDGTNMYLIDSTNDAISEYDLTTAWDVSSASYVQNFSLSSQDTGPTGGFFNPDGTKLFVVGIGNDSVYQYSLSTSWDVSSASYDSLSFSIGSQEATPQSLFFKSDGSKMYIVGSGSDTIYQYSTD